MNHYRSVENNFYDIEIERLAAAREQDARREPD